MVVVSYTTPRSTDLPVTVAPATAAPLLSVTVPVTVAVTSWPQAHWNIPAVATYMVSNTSSEQQNALDGRLITNLLEDTSLECRRNLALHIEHMLYSRAMMTVKKKVSSP